MPELVAHLEIDVSPPTPDRVLWRATVQSVITVLGRRKAERFMQALAANLALDDSVANVMPIRTPKGAAVVLKAREEAAAIFAMYQPLFRAMMGRL